MISRYVVCMYVWYPVHVVCVVFLSLYARCDIPVIIMGETGCGKTRLVCFLCELQKPAGVEVQNMVLMKVRRLPVVFPYTPHLCAHDESAVLLVVRVIGQ